MAGRKYMDVNEAAEYLKIKPKYCRKLVFLKKIPYYKPAGRLYFLEEDLERYIRRGRCATDYEPHEEADRILNDLG